MRDFNELLEIGEVVRTYINDNFEGILSKLNRTEQLDSFLNLIGMSELAGNAVDDAVRYGKILVVGQTDVEKDKLLAVAKTYGIEKDRFEFVLNYKDPKTYNFRKTQWSSNYSCILAGPMPHSGSAKGDYSSILSALESEKGYPRVIRMGTNELKITKSSFRTTIEYILSQKVICAC